MTLSLGRIQQVARKKEQLAGLVPLSPADLSFLDDLLEQGRMTAEVLTADPALQARIRWHPMLNWKALNVRKHRGW